MCFSLRLFSACVLSLTLSVVAKASELPRFDGVYIRTVTGEFVELRRFERRHEFCHMPYSIATPFEGRANEVELRVPSPSDTMGPFEHSLIHVEAADFSRLPVVPHGVAESIFIRSRIERLTWVGFVTLSAQYFEKEVTNRRIHVALNGRCGNRYDPYRWSIDERIPGCLATYPSWHRAAGRCRIPNNQSGNFLPHEDRLLSGYVLDACGMSASSFRLLNETETTWEYFPSGFALTLAPLNRAPRVGECGKIFDRTNALRVGTQIHTNQGIYLVAHLSPTNPLVVMVRERAIRNIQRSLEFEDVFFIQNPVE